MEELYNLCTSDNISLTSLRDKISQLSIGNVTQEVYNKHPFLHSICMNWNFTFTLEIVECILDSFPGAVSWQTDKYDYNRSTATTLCVLHCACYNMHCPGSVIKLLLEEYKAAAKCLATVEHGVQDWNVVGLPLHYYLTRKSNIDIDIVKMLVEAYPQSLVVTDETYACYPIHAAAINSSTNNLSEIIEYFLELEPTSLRVLDGDGSTPLHLACENERMNLELFKLLYNSWPDAIRMPNPGLNGNFPIHEICYNRMLEDTDALAILRFMIDIDQTIVRGRDSDGYLPIHRAVRCKSLAFCKALIDSYLESLRVRTNHGSLPIHSACGHYGSAANIDTIQYMLDLYPESINIRTADGRHFPIHNAAQGKRTDIVELLLKYDPDAASKESSFKRRLPLHVACGQPLTEHLDVVKILYDAFPQAITIRDGDGKSPIDLASERNNSTIINFLQAQQTYIRQATDSTAMTTPDHNGWLPLHHALKDKAPLGSIKLLLKGNLSAIRVVSNIGTLPIHIACKFSSIKVVRHLVELDIITVSHLDRNKDSVLHYACRRGNLGVIRYLVDSHASLVSDTNADNRLPFHLLLECETEQVRESLEFTEVCFRLLRSHPETVTNLTSRKRKRYQHMYAKLN